VHDNLMLAFVIVAAVAIVLQMVILFALYRSLRQTSQRFEGIAGRLENQTSPVLVTAHAILDDAQPKIAEITSNLAESTATLRASVAQVGEATGEIVDRARLQAERLDELVSNTVDKIEDTTEIVQNSVISPIRRIHAIVKAVSAGVGFLRANSSRRKADGNSTDEEDEEMFI
jgi:methyl-accepting chemotaxis protein